MINDAKIKELLFGRKFRKAFPLLVLMLTLLNWFLGNKKESYNMFYVFSSFFLTYNVLLPMQEFDKSQEEDMKRFLRNHDEISNALKYLSSEYYPDKLKCPLTGKLFKHPVSTIYGNFYERKAICKYMHEFHRDPLNGKSLSRSEIIEFPELGHKLKQKRAFFRFKRENIGLAFFSPRKAYLRMAKELGVNPWILERSATVPQLCKITG